MTNLGSGGVRVLHLLAPASFGGLESVVRSLARGLRAAGADAQVGVVLRPQAGAHPFVAALEGDATPVHVLTVPGRGYARERAQVTELIDRFRPNVVHTHGYRPDVVDAPVARARGLATLTTVHGFTGKGLKNRIYEWLQRRAFRRFDAVLAVSRPLARSLVDGGVAEGSVHLVPNAWESAEAPASRAEARRSLGIAEVGPPAIGWVGRLSREKGADVLIEALALPSLSEAEVHLVGGGGAEPELRRRAESLGLTNRIAWHGWVAEAGELMAAFDVLALPSRTEGTPMVLFEATAVGVPVVASAVGGVPEVLGEGFNLVPAGDAPALAEALARALARDGDRDEAVRRAAERIARHFRLDRWIDAHLDLYRALSS